MIIHGELTPLVQFLDTNVNKSFKARMKKKWEHWLEVGEREYTKSGKRKSPTNRFVSGWKKFGNECHGEFIIKGFRENGYIGSGDLDRLHSRLRDTISSRKVPDEVIDEVNAFIVEFAVMDRERGQRQRRRRRWKRGRGNLL